MTHPPDTQSFTIERRVGRVIEARVFRLRSPDDANRYSVTLATVVARTPPELRPVLCADHRPVAVYSQAVSDRLIELFLQMNARIQRIAILVAPTNAVLAMQLGRIVREAGNEARKVFQAGGEAVAHLSAVLDPGERARVRDFVAEFTPQ